MSGATAGYSNLAADPLAEAGVDREFLRSLPAVQQPEWHDAAQLAAVTSELEEARPLVDGTEIDTLKALLARVAAGELNVLQAGDCAEDPAECTPEAVAPKAALLDVLASVMSLNAGRRVLRVGRIAGQFGKPRSKPTEHVDGQELPVFRGHMVNGPEADPVSRRAQPERLLAGYHLAAAVSGALRDRGAAGDPVAHAPIWTSHEALLLDYELPMIRRDSDGRALLTSTHWPWIGDRTRQVDGAHLTMLAMVANPVACKVGPSTTADDLLAICEQLDPDREPGRLTLISRMGANALTDRLPPLVAAVRAAGHPAIWMCDPMHGNTMSTPSGLKTRLVERVIQEVRDFQRVVPAAGGVAGGLHLETTPTGVTECADDLNRLHEVGDVYTSFCDPRLNPNQAITVAKEWQS
ncbi:3-deoxy-7-phosphoheptulonate synthase [Kribbella sp. NBC_00382]|uniref:3-deoxy-7-phosphoheptulonate synthase n=1 Tax=Kribbella sp. NBC_00382 TaxID=2975967 RepID=UPI002E1E7BD4